MADFIYWSQWLKRRDPKLHEEFISVGPSEDWSDEKASTQRVNGDQYTARGIRSRYAITKMRAETRKCKNRAK